MNIDKCSDVTEILANKDVKTLIVKKDDGHGRNEM